MFRNKKELDLHVQDVLSKLQGEREKSMRCFNIAKQYAAIKEFVAAKRHMEKYLTTNPSNAADALKLMGDFTVETGDLEKALDYYKSSYKHRKNREALSRICDLLERGCGTREDQRNGNQKWFELLKSTDTTSNSSPLPYYHDSNPINNHRSSIGAGQPKSVFSINNRPHLQTSTPIKSMAQVVNGIGSHGDTFAPKITSSPEKADSPILNLERRYDDILAKILGSVQRIENDMKDLRGKVENLQKESEKASTSAKAAENSSKSNDSTDAKQKAVNENSFFPNPQLPHVPPYFQPNPAFGFGFPYQAPPFHNPYFNTNPMLAALYGNPLLGNPLAGLGVPRNGVPQAATVLPNETSLLAGLLSQNQFIPPSSLNSLGTQPVESLYPQVPLQASMTVNSSLTDKLWQQPQQELPTVTVGQSIFSNPNNSLSVTSTSISSIVNPVNTLKLGTEDKSNITVNQPVVAAPPSKIENTETRPLSSATTATFAAVSNPSFAAVSNPSFAAVSNPSFADVSKPTFTAVTTPAFAAVSKPTVTVATTPTFGSINTTSAATPTSTLATTSTLTSATTSTLTSATTPKLISATTPTITSANTTALASAVTPVLASGITPVSVPATTPVGKKETPKGKTLFPENVVVSNTEKVPTVPSSSYSNIMSVTIPPEHRNAGTGSSSSILTNTHGFQISAPTFKPLELSIDKKSEATVNPFSNIALKASTAISFGDLATNGIASGFGGGKNSFEGGAKEVFANVVASQSAAGDAVVRHDKDRVDGDETVDDFVPTAEFQPVIPLPPLVEVKKGNENENKLFEHRAKIYRFVKETKEWKERGVGNIIILQDKDDDRKIRVVMWRERVYKLACNHRITKDLVIEYHQGSTKVLKWTAMDFADAESDGKLEIFTCRFGQEDKCAEFKATMERMIAFLATKGESSPQKESTKTVEQPKVEMKPLSELFKKSAGSWDCEACYVNNSETLSKCLSCGTPKPSLQTAKLNVAKQPKAELKPFSELFKKPSGSWDCGACYVNNAEKDTKCVSCGTAKPFVFQPSFGQFGTKEEKKADIEKPAAVSVDDKVQELNTNAFSGIKLAAASAPSFGDLAKNAASTGFSVWQSKPFAGSGAPVFGFSAPVPVQSSPAPAVAGGSTEVESKENEETVEEFVPTAEFQPVIPLPPLVEVKKGNENENVLFEHRAKIYRFVKETKEWKERGVGNIMILQDKDNERKIRVVMWRERVYKLACNHRITKDLVVENHQGSQKVLKWTAMDFADGESDGKMEIFTCRFGQEDKCAEFKASMERMIAFLATQGESSSPQAEKTKVEEPRNVEQKPLSELFKKSAGSWDCGACYVNNTEKNAKCVSCGTANPLSIAQKQPGTWQCASCSTIQNEESVKCVNCGTAKAGHTCSGCRGCEPDSFDFGELDKRVLPAYPKEAIQKIPDSSGENQLDKINSQKCTPIVDSQIYEMLTPDTSPKKITDPTSSDSAPNSSAAPSQFKFGFSGINNSSISNANSVVSSPKFNFQFNSDTSLSSVSSPVIKVPQFKFGFTETTNSAPTTEPFKPLENPESDLSSATTVNQEPSISINPNIFVPSDESQQISSTSVGDGNEADNDNDNEDDDANDEEDALFESDAHLFTSESLDSNAELDDVGNGFLRIIYDGEQLCSRLYFMKDDEIVIDHIIAAETALEPAGDLAFEWFGVNEIDETAIKIKMRVKLPNHQTSDEFSRTMAESTEYAVKALVKESCLLGYD